MAYETDLLPWARRDNFDRSTAGEVVDFNDTEGDEALVHALLAEASPGFGSPRRTPRPVRASFVSCNPPSPAIARITGPDPVSTIRRANKRAVEFLDRAITELEKTRSKIRGGASPVGTVSRRLRRALRRRFHLNAANRSIWTSTGRRSVFVIIRRLRGSRQILADGWMKYTCLGPAAPARVTISRGGSPCTVTGCEKDEVAFTCGGNSRIVLCKPWWKQRLKDQAGTLMHEALHIYFEFISDSGNFINAHCYEQLVLDINGKAPTPGFERACP